MARSRTTGSQGKAVKRSAASSGKSAASKKTAAAAPTSRKAVAAASGSSKSTPARRAAPASRATQTRKTSGSPKPASARASASSARRESAAGRGAAVSEPTKDQLIERIEGRLRRLKRPELISLSERLDAGTLRFSDLALSGEGGFGFQEKLRKSGKSGDQAESDDKGPLEKVRGRITSIVK